MCHRQDPCRHFQQSTLPRTICTTHAHDFTALDREGYPLQGPEILVGPIVAPQEPHKGFFQGARSPFPAAIAPPHTLKPEHFVRDRIHAVVFPFLALFRHRPSLTSVRMLQERLPESPPVGKAPLPGIPQRLVMRVIDSSDRRILYHRQWALARGSVGDSSPDEETLSQALAAVLYVTYICDTLSLWRPYAHWPVN